MPERLRAKPISILNATELEWCTDFDNDLYDMAGISENILLKRGTHYRCIWTHLLWFIRLFSRKHCFAGNFNLFAIICAVGFITIAIIVLIIVLSVNRHTAKYYTNEDKRCGEFETCTWLFNLLPAANSHIFESQMDCTRKISIRFQSPGTS